MNITTNHTTGETVFAELQLLYGVEFGEATR